MKLKLEVEDNLNELVQDCIQEVKEWFSYEIENKNIEKEDYYNIDSLIDALNYNGSLTQIIDVNVPIYTHDLDTLYYLHKHKLEDAFFNCGIGEKSDFEKSPLGFEGVAIYCYLELEVLEWLSSEFENWFSSKFWSVD
tara:strand:- start:9 stop:422 length:414 start_codon:yes stop_codon:yes gene_type:complete